MEGVPIMQELIQEVLDYEQNSYMPHNGTIDKLKKILQKMAILVTILSYLL